MAGKEAEGRLQARPTGAASGAAPVGLRELGPGGARAGYLYVPQTYRAGSPAPLAVLLHGAGEDARDGLALLRAQADAAGLILLAPTSHEYTWDILVGRRYGPDVAALDRALEHAFSRCAVDPGRVAVGGYSDGASYALSLGIANGDLFTHVLAFSPGFLAPPGRRGRPRQPHDRPPAPARRLRGALPGVRGWPRGPARDRTRGRGLVRRSAKLRTPGPSGAPRLLR
jgi:phospholipase/carboxylesterase